MKIRNGFVSNSSSSSFICDICNHDASGWDMGLEEAEMYECGNGHQFCEEHAINMEDDKQMAINLVVDAIDTANKSDREYHKESIPEYEKQLLELKNGENKDYEQIMEDFEYRYYFPTKSCPICQMEHVKDDDMVKFLLTKHDLTEEVVKSEIKEKFDSYDELKNYIK